MFVHPFERLHRIGGRRVLECLQQRIETPIFRAPTLIGVPAAARVDSEQNHAFAQYNLAANLEYGIGVEANIEEAMRWYHKAANHGIPVAQMRLGLAYYAGEGVERDPVEAHKWLLLSADAGELQAQPVLEEVSELLTEQQLAAARRAADRWNKRHFSAQSDL